MTIDYLGHLRYGGELYPYFAFQVPAGFPSPAQDHLEPEISLDELFNLRAPHTYLVRVSGDSMVLTGIFDGDLLIVDRSLEVKHRDIVIAALNNEPMVKRFCREGGLLVLRSENAKYAPRYIMESDELSVWGVVRYSVRCHDIA